jgi:hypothetical protein
VPSSGTALVADVAIFAFAAAGFALALAVAPADDAADDAVAIGGGMGSADSEKGVGTALAARLRSLQRQHCVRAC